MGYSPDEVHSELPSITVVKTIYNPKPRPLFKTSLYKMYLTALQSSLKFTCKQKPKITKNKNFHFKIKQNAHTKNAKKELIQERSIEVYYEQLLPLDFGPGYSTITLKGRPVPGEKLPSFIECISPHFNPV